MEIVYQKWRFLYWKGSWDRLNINIVSIAILIIKIKLFRDSIIFIMEIIYWEKLSLYWNGPQALSVGSHYVFALLTCAELFMLLQLLQMSSAKCAPVHHQPSRRLQNIKMAWIISMCISHFALHPLHIINNNSNNNNNNNKCSTRGEVGGSATRWFPNYCQVCLLMAMSPGGSSLHVVLALCVPNPSRLRSFSAQKVPLGAVSINDHVFQVKGISTVYR